MEGAAAGERPIPEVGLFRFLKHSLEILENPLPFHHGNFEKLGDTFRLRVGLKRSVVFSRDAGLLEYALQKNWKNFTKTGIQTRDLARYLGKGLLTSEGDLWRTQRKLIQPGFHKKQLDTLYGKMQTIVREELSGFSPGGPTDLYPLFGRLAFRVVVESLFSGAVTEEEIRKLQHSTEANQSMLVRELRQPYLHWYFERFGVIRRHLELTRASREVLRAVIRKRKQQASAHGDLLDMLLEARYEDGSQMEEDQLIDEILVLFVAGHETTANALSFTVQLLARHPEWQEAIRAEADTTRAGAPGSVTQQVIEESMRLYPPAYFIDRMNLQADTFAGLQLPAHTDLLFSVYEIHRHPDHWEQPEEFRPERFAPGVGSPPVHYYPFGAGPRKCIGAYFAMTEMKMVLQGLLGRFNVAPVGKEIRIQPLITLKPRDARVHLSKHT
ncbi:cytochrome P450 [Robiginitalea sp. SC105]|uniref:cytochrome P450 n=1 Tax=Robiginitalea sp. SC105 TaxID=2762332 RepID=UPI0016398B77|nr:cytochrome P450 [Robiginitalea sp. SC105]MBC2838769.1 cytochrome P450 [Robiginitalea sp. SC105]